MKATYLQNFYPSGERRSDRSEKTVTVRWASSPLRRICCVCGGEITPGEQHLIEVANHIQRFHPGCEEEIE